MIKDCGLSEKNISELKKAFQKHPKIESVILYGSRALGTFKEGSDIDLCLRAPQMTLSELLKIENELDDLMLPYKVDLSLHHKIENEDLLKHIKEHGVNF